MSDSGCKVPAHSRCTEVSCLLSLSSGVCPHPGRPKALTDSFSPEHHPNDARLHTAGSAAANPTPPASNTHLQAGDPWWPHGPLISLGSGDAREEKKEKVNSVGVLENLTCQEGKGWAQESPP